LAGGVAAMTQDPAGLAGALGAAIVVGVIIGAVQGSLIAYANIPAFIVTLGGLLAWRGVILGLSKGATIPVRIPFFRELGVGKLPQGVGVVIAVAALGAFLTQNTTFGRYLYAIGGNPDAARLSGINIRRYILAAYCVLGLLVGVASLLHTARVGSASPDAGTYMELDAIAACVIGGTSLMGGRGTVSGAVVGALIMASLDNGMSLLNVENYTQYIVKGAVLVAAVGFDMLGRRKS